MMDRARQTLAVPAHQNPFRSERIEALAFRFPPGVDWTVVERRLDYCNGLGAIVGPKGTGKTTFLERFAQRESDAGRRVQLIRLRPEQRPDARRLALDPTASTLLMDSAGLLSARRLKALARRLGQPWTGIRPSRAIVSLHRPGPVAVTRTGRVRRLWPTLLRTRCDDALLRQLVADLLGRPLEPARDGEIRLDALRRRHRGNLREALAELYDRFASPTDPVASLPRSGPNAKTGFSPSTRRK